MVSLRVKPAMCTLFLLLVGIGAAPPALAEVSHRVSVVASGFAASYEGRVGLRYGVGLPGPARQERFSSQVSIRGDAGVSFTTAREHDDDRPWPGATVWAGPRLGWAGVKQTEGVQLGVDIGLTLAPSITFFEHSVRRMSLALRPGIELRYGWLLLIVGAELNVVLSRTAAGPWDKATDKSVVPGAHGGIGMVF